MTSEAAAGASPLPEAGAVASIGGVRELPPWRRFHVRTTFFFGSLALLLLSTMGFASYQWARATELSALQARLRALAVALADGVPAAQVDDTLTTADPSAPSYRSMVALFAAVAEDEADVQSIYVVVPTEERGHVRFAADWVRTGTPATIGEPYDARGFPRLVAAFDGPTFEETVKVDAWGPSLSGYAPIRDASGRGVAVLGIDVNAQRIARIDRHALVATTVVYSAALLVLIATGLLLGRSVRRPIERIIEATAAIVADPKARVGLDRRDELGILARHFDRMAAGLEERERIRAIFGRYVSDEVARRVLASPEAARLGGEVREITVLFIDLSRFASVSEALEPGDVVEVLEVYLTAMTELVEEHGGCVIEMLGDAMLAVFGAPDALADHPASAVRCGVAMKARLEALNDEWAGTPLAERFRAHGLERLRARIGVHTGRVVAGNTGGKTRMKYAVIGDTVNVAARIEALNERLDTVMLVSADVHARLPESLAATGEARGAHAVKGRDRPVSVYAY